MCVVVHYYTCTTILHVGDTILLCLCLCVCSCGYMLCVFAVSVCRRQLKLCVSLYVCTYTVYVRTHNVIHVCSSKGFVVFLFDRCNVSSDNTC